MDCIAHSYASDHICAEPRSPAERRRFEEDPRGGAWDDAGAVRGALRSSAARHREWAPPRPEAPDAPMEGARAPSLDRLQAAQASRGDEVDPSPTLRGGPTDLRGNAHGRGAPRDLASHAPCLLSEDL